MLVPDIILILIVLSGIAYLVTVYGILRSRGLREGAVPLLLALIAASFGWVVLASLHRGQWIGAVHGFDMYALERIRLYFLLAGSVIFFQLTRSFLRQPGSGMEWWAGGAAVIALVALLYENPLRLPDVLWQGGGYQMLRWLAAFGVLVIAWGVYMGGALLLTARSYGKTTSPLHRNRGKYWSIAATLAVAGQAAMLANQPAIGSMLFLPAVITTAYVLLTYNLPDLRLASRRIASYAIISLITAAVYAGGYFGVRYLMPEAAFNPVLTGVVLAATLAVLFNPLLGLLNGLISRLINGARYDARQTLAEYSMSISNIVDIEVLATVVVGLISEAMEISHGALAIVRHEPDENFWEEGNGYYHLRSISGLGQEMPEGRLAGKNPAVYSLRREHHPLTQYDIDLLPRFKEMDADEREWITGLRMDVFVPIYAKGQWIGVLALGPKSSGDRYFDEDLVLLQTLADQTAVALENARLFDDLRQRNAENERLNEELKAANAELARLDQAKSDFINIASHELRTPLTQVIGYNDILGEMIRGGDLEAKSGAQMTDAVRKAARRLEEIVETMFDVSKVDTKTLDLMRGPVTVSGIVGSAVSTWQKGLEDRRQNVTVRGMGHLPAISADSKRLIQVFSHLVQNAIKSTPDGGQIRISGRMVEPGDEGVAHLAGLNGHSYVEVVVADSGIGIAPDDLERIFEKFYRVGSVLLHSTGDTKFKGAGPGLGLTIARGIVEAHGGRIWAESPGQDEESCPGAKFHVLLPVKVS